MLFNSLEFAIFLPIVFILYWFITNKSIRLQNFLVVIASYVFYGWWDWRFLSLLFFSTVVDYLIGLGLLTQNSKKMRKALLGTSILVNLGLLGFFKYYNFFLENFISAFTLFGVKPQIESFKIILPVGISFYTFQTLSYTIDVYKNKIAPTKNFIAFAAFVSFFPQLVAGPIERATHLVPQFYKKRTFDYTKAVDGMRQILWGLFKKIVIADNCAQYANLIFNDSANFSGSTLFLGAIFFAFQIYGDFSGYSDIAIGTARLFGFGLMNNFAYPYFSRDIAEFWRRWHISLSTWFRDYLYIPLGGSRGSRLSKIRNIFIIFIVSGFWHGANWTFIAWGALNAVYFLPLLLTNKNRDNLNSIAQGHFLPSIKEAVNMVTTFMLTLLAWIFFRAENITHALAYISSIFSKSFFTLPHFTESIRIQYESILTLCLIAFFILIEWIGRESLYAISKVASVKSKTVRTGVYVSIVITIILFSGSKQNFIYFQF